MKGDDIASQTPRMGTLNSEGIQTKLRNGAPLVVFHLLIRSAIYTFIITALSYLAILLLLGITSLFGLKSFPGEGLMLFVVLLYANFMLWILGIGIWRAGQSTNSFAMNLHNQFTPPHSDSGTLSKKVAAEFDVPEISDPSGDMRHDLKMAGRLTLWAVIIVTMVSLLITSVDPIQGLFEGFFNWIGDGSESNDGIGIVAGIFSVLLGRAMGLVALSAFFIADSPGMIALFLIVVVLPGIFLEPAAENIIGFVTKVHFELVADRELKNKVGRLLVLLLAYILAGIYLYSVLASAGP